MIEAFQNLHLAPDTGLVAFDLLLGNHLQRDVQFDFSILGNSGISGIDGQMRVGRRRTSGRGCT